MTIHSQDKNVIREFALKKVPPAGRGIAGAAGFCRAWARVLPLAFPGLGGAGFLPRRSSSSNGAEGYCSE